MIKTIFLMMGGAGFIASLGILGTLDTMSNQTQNENQLYVMLTIAVIAFVVGFVGAYLTEQREIKAEQKRRIQSRTAHYNGNDKAA